MIRTRTLTVNKPEAHIQEEPVTIEGHRITGDDSVLLRVQADSIEEPGEVIDQLAVFGMPGTSVVLSSIVER